MPHALFDLGAGFSIVDIETTGDRSAVGHIIEIGIVNIQNFKVTGTYHTLIRPPIAIPPFITKLTGISNDHVAEAPRFAGIKDMVTAFIGSNYFVAHHVHFDYAFVKSELERLGEYFYRDRFCTVSLSRKFFPEYKKHNLDELIQRFDVHVKNRHRALDDALATAEIFVKFLKLPNAEAVFAKYAETFDRTEKWVERLEKQIFDLPNGKGVYMFKDQYDLPLYIGKSNTIRSRILSHLREDDIPRKRRLLRYTDHFDVLACDTELEALILESKLIKKHLPHYNIQQRQRKGYFFVKATRDPYPRMFQTAVKDADGAEYAGPFRSSKFIDQILQRVQKFYKLCPELMKEKHSKKGFCFSYQLKQCSGACGGEILPEVYQATVDEAMGVIAEYTRLDNKQDIDAFLRSRFSKQADLKPLTTALRSLKIKMKETPQIFEHQYLVVQPEEEVGYFIKNGLLEKVLSRDELEDQPLLEELVNRRRLDAADNDESLDERMTIQRFVRANRTKLKIVTFN